MPDNNDVLDQRDRGGGLRFMLLALLAKSPNTGYGLGRLLRGEWSHVWEARLQQIYGELATLRRRGLVDVTMSQLQKGPSKKTHAVTSKGAAALRQWLHEGSRSVHRDDLLVQLLCIEEVGPQALLERLHERRQERTGQIQAIEASLSAAKTATGDGLARALTLDAVLLRLRAEVEWCERASHALTTRVAASLWPRPDASGEQNPRRPPAQ